MSCIRLYGNSADAFGQRKEEGAFGLRDNMSKRFLLVLALGLVLTLLFAVSATAGSLLECKGELPGGYTFTGPEEVTVSIDVRNAGDEDFPGPVELYYPDLTQVEEFGSPTLAAGSNRNWEGKWKVTQKELEEGVIAFYVRYPVKDEKSGELTTKAKKLSFKISYAGAEPELDIRRSFLPAVAQKNQEVSVIYEISNTGAAEVSNVTIKENSAIAATAGAIKSIAPGETKKFVFTAKMGTKDLTSEATVTYKAGGKNYSSKVEADTIKYGTMDLTATLSADKKGGAPGDTVKLTLKLKNSGKGDYTNVNVTDETLGEVFSGETVKAGETVTLEKDLIVTETTDLQFIVKADGADGNALETATGRVHVVATDPTKQVVLSVEASADRSQVYKIPGGVVRFTITVRNESAVEVRGISVKAVEREVYLFDAIPSGESRSVTRDMEISMAGNFQFTANAKDELGQTVTFASNTIPIAYAPPTPEPTEAPLVTPPAPATYTIPAPTKEPDWIEPTERIAGVAWLVLLLIALPLCILLVIGAVRRGIRKSQSNKAMDHLEGANYRDYSVAPRRGKRNEIVSGEEERREETAGEAETAETQQAAPAGEEQSSDLMAETLKRLYDDPAENTETAETAGAAEEIAEEVKETAEEAAEAAAESVQAETENVAQSMQEATRRRRTGRK